MRIIARHLLREFAQTSAAVLAGLLVMWAAADVLLHVDELARDFGRGMREVVLRGLPVLPVALPISKRSRLPCGNGLKPGRAAWIYLPRAGSTSGRPGS